MLLSANFFSLISVALSLTGKSSNSGTDVKFVVSEGHDTWLVELIIRTGRTIKQTLFFDWLLAGDFYSL